MAQPRNADSDLTEADLVAAIDATETEIAESAFGKEGDENDGDNALEQMDDPAGDDPEAEDEVDAAAEGEGETEADEGEGGEEADPEPENRDDQGRFVPSYRVREETARARAAEAERDQLRAELAALNSRVSAVERPRREAEQPVKPDMFADPEGYELYLTEKIRNEDRQGRFNSALEVAAELHGDEFRHAYSELEALGKARDPEGTRVFNLMLRSPDPGAVLMRWAEPRLAEFREQQNQAEVERALSVLERHNPDAARAFRQPQAGRNGNGRPQQTRSITRPAQTLPSLNGQGGSGSHRANIDPRGIDGSEASIFADAFRD